MQLKDFDYYLPKELIAQSPMDKRDECRLLVANRNNKEIEHKKFYDIVDYLNEGDCLVLNDTRVMPARLIGTKEGTGGKVEILLLKRIDKNRWETLVKPGRRVKAGMNVIFGNGELKAHIESEKEDGGRIVYFQYEGIFEEILDKLGQVPLPPYIKKKLDDDEKYQTVYSKNEGSAAAPTAGLHFTFELLDKLKAKGVKIVYLTLHVGIGTFRPVKEDKIEDHKMHSEYYILSKEAADTINETRRNGKRIVAVGTTSMRTLETVGDSNRMVKESSGWTDIFIYPGYKFKVVDALITNFHLPESTLVMLVSAFSSLDIIKNAYSIAVKEKYRFFSFGDAMLIK